MLLDLIPVKQNFLTLKCIERRDVHLFVDKILS
jgi:hypothetical protein